MTSKKVEQRSFDIKDCAIPQIWCGESETPPKKKGDVYYKTGSRYECLKKGFGAGKHTERKENLDADSLQQIKYVGDKHEADMKKRGINNISDLLAKCRKNTLEQNKSLLQDILTKSNKVIDARAYNSTLLYLYSRGITKIPTCQKIKM